MSDTVESVANAALGYLVSLAGVWLLRSLGLWDAPGWIVGAVFFGLSFARSRALRWFFRAREAS